MTSTSNGMHITTNKISFNRLNGWGRSRLDSKKMLFTTKNKPITTNNMKKTWKPSPKAHIKRTLIYANFWLNTATNFSQKSKHKKQKMTNPRSTTTQFSNPMNGRKTNSSSFPQGEIKTTTCSLTWRAIRKEQRRPNNKIKSKKPRKTSQLITQFTSWSSSLSKKSQPLCSRRISQTQLNSSMKRKNTTRNSLLTRAKLNKTWTRRETRNKRPLLLTSINRKRINLSASTKKSSPTCESW